MKPGIILVPADAELPVRVERTIASEKRMLVVFWGIHGIVHYCYLPKDRTFDLPLFCEKVLSPFAQKMRPNSKSSQTLDFDSYGQYNGSRDKGSPRQNGCSPIQMHATATV
jgi:hypothetical protein